MFKSFRTFSKKVKIYSVNKFDFFISNLQNLFSLISIIPNNMNHISIFDIFLFLKANKFLFEKFQNIHVPECSFEELNPSK